MQKIAVPLDQSQLHGLGVVMGFFCVSFGLIALYSWYTEAPFMIPRLFPIVAFLVSMGLGYKVWKFFSLEYAKVGHISFAKFASVICLPFLILSSADIFDQLAQSFIWTKGIATVEDVQRTALLLTK